MYSLLILNTTNVQFAKSISKTSKMDPWEISNHLFPPGLKPTC